MYVTVDMCAENYINHNMKSLSLVSYFTRTEMCQQILENLPDIECNENLFSSPQVIDINPHLRCLCRAVDLNTKFRKILNGGYFALRLLTGVIEIEC
jgi:hypothetical protein